MSATYQDRRRRAQRVAIDGRMVAVGRKHGTLTTARYWFCECIPCKQTLSRARRKQAKKQQSLYQERRRLRKMINGRWVATRAPCHGETRIYTHWSCRCEPCCQAQSDYRKGVAGDAQIRA